MLKSELREENVRLHTEIEKLKKQLPVTEDRVREIIGEEIVDKLVVSENTHDLDENGSSFDVFFNGKYVDTIST